LGGKFPSGYVQVSGFLVKGKAGKPRLGRTRDRIATL
jgi:hypothetical protein